MLRAILLFVLGALLGPVGDYFHVASRTTIYPSRAFLWDVSLFGMPVWVPALFGVATIVIGLTHPALDRLFGAPKGRPGARSWLGASSGLVIFLGLYAASAYLPLATGGWRDVALGLGALSIWAIWDGTWGGLVLGAMTAVAGCAVELGLVRGGVFGYAPENGNVLGIASWLPWLYLGASVTVGNIGRRLAAPKPSHAAGQTGQRPAGTTTGRFSTTTGRKSTTTGRSSTTTGRRTGTTTGRVSPPPS